MTDTLPLWRQARDFLVSLFVIFHGPEHIVAQGVLMPREARLIQSWLRSMETMLRQLLLIEAAALPKPEIAPPRPRAKRAHAPRSTTQDPDKPETWRVAFQMIERTSLARRTHRPRGKTDAVARNPWPLAERFEAALRVFNDPAPYALRLGPPPRARAAPRGADLAGEPRPRRAGRRIPRATRAASRRRHRAFQPKRLAGHCLRGAV